MVDFGTDSSVNPRLNFELVSGRRNLAEALLRRLKTPRGGLWYDPNYGTDIRQYLNHEYDPEGVEIAFEIEQKVISEVTKDPRVKSAVCRFMSGGLADRYGKIHLVVTTAAGPFDLVLSIDQITGEVVAQ